MLDSSGKLLAVLDWQRQQLQTLLQFGPVPGSRSTGLLACPGSLSGLSACGLFAAGGATLIFEVELLDIPGKTKNKEDS
jgi:hypothetical protein